MRKFSVISVILFLSLIFLTEPAKALVVYESEDTFIYLIEGEPIDPADAFDKSKMVRTFVYDGVEYEDLSVVKAYNNQFEIYWFSDYFIPGLEWDKKRLLADGMQPPPITNELIDISKERFVQKLCAGAYDYPKWDIVSINGEPWQNTFYADVIIQEVGETVKPGELLADRNSEAWAMFMDPRTNGASHVWFGDPDDPDYPGSSWTAVTEYWVDKITKYNPLNNGKPFDFSSWQSPISNQISNQARDNEQQTPTGEQLITEVFPNPQWQQAAILHVGQPQVTTVNRGETKINVLNAAPEVVSGRTMIPLRGVLDEFGYQLNYEGNKQAIFLTGHGQSIILIIGKSVAIVDGKEVVMDQPAIIKNGRALVPLRFVSENLGFKVDYDNGKITISK